MSEINKDSYDFIHSILIGGLFVAFIGETGEGKTCTMTWYAYWINKRIKENNLPIKLYANYHLKHIPEQNLYWDYTYLNHPEEMLKIKEGFVFVDELWGWCLDSYSTKRKAQSQFDKLMGRGRKRGLSVFASSQRFMRLDPNFRFNVHYLIVPHMTIMHGKPYTITVHVVNNHTDLLEGKPFIINPNIIFPMYDTREEIQTYDELSTREYSKFAEEFWQWNKREMVNQHNQVIEIAQPCTQALVNLFLAEKKLKHQFTREESKMLYVACNRMKEVMK